MIKLFGSWVIVPSTHSSYATDIRFQVILEEFVGQQIALIAWIMIAILG